MKLFKAKNVVVKKFNDNKNKIIPAFIVFMIIFLVVSITESVIYFRDSRVNAAGTVVSDDGKFVIPECNADSPKGSKDNPFVVLEIVPGASSASFGYLVGGQEPIDIEKALKEEPAAKDILSKYVDINEDGTGYTNTDLFKKFGIGLAYKDNDITNGEDIARFDFGGWYLEKECVNRVDADMRLTEDTTVYAKWIAVYPTDEVNQTAGKKETYKPQYTVKFDAGCNEQDSVVGMPADITHIDEYASLVEPLSVPRLKDKLFAGWYTDSGCTKPYSFSDRVSSDVTLYAKWIELPAVNYTLQFEANLPAEVSAESVSGMPETIENYAKNGMGADFADVTPASEPAVPGYWFTGWYYDSGCTRPFVFGQTVPDDIAAGDVTLYAGWAKDGDETFTLWFDANEPADAVAEAKRYKEFLESDVSGKVTELAAVLADEPVLEGNIAKKVNNYNVKVITTTPEDFFEYGYEFVKSNGGTSEVYAKNKHGEHNLQLIDRADMIYISEAYHDQMKAQTNPKEDDGRLLMNLYAKYKNKDMWYDRGYMDENNPPPEYDPQRLYRREPVFLGMYNGESSIDFDWRTTMRLFKKNTVGSKGDGTDAVPVIYDLKSIGSKLPNGDTSLGMDQPSHDAEFTTSDGKHVSLNASEYLGKASKKNTYKLYLMLIQMDPVTVYNAYIDGQSRYGKICVDGEHAGCFEYYDEEKDIHVYTDKWTYNTLMPVETISSEVWEEYRKDNNCYEWNRNPKDEQHPGGVEDPSDKTGISGSLGFNDYPKLDNSALYYNSLATDTVDSSLVLELLNRSPVTPDDGMKDFIPKEVAKTEGYNMTNALYYLLNGNRAPKKYEDDVRVLDIEPSDGEGAHKDSSFWFWYISKYIRNFSGKVNVTETTTWEFAGNIDDLNSEYDLIYLGGNIGPMHDNLKDMMPGHDVKINEWQTENKKYLYAHNGAVMDNVKLTNRAGTLGDTTADSAVTKFIASGNDLTKIKYNDLLQFAEAGYPVVIARELVNGTFIKGELSAKDINTDSVDRASYVYRLMHTLVTGKKTDGSYKYRSAVFSENENDDSRKEDFVNALTKNRFSVKISSMPPEYVDRTQSKYAGYLDKDVYVNGDNINDKSLEFKLKIEGDKADRYTLNIYIDTNADGRYETNERLDALEIKDVTSGKSVRYNNLTGGHTFTISREIDNYAGAIPWMLEIYDNSNKLIRRSITGQCAVKVAEKTRLNVLQIVSENENKFFKNNVYLPTDEEISKAYELYGPVTVANMRNYFAGCIEPIERLKDDIKEDDEQWVQDIAKTEMANVLANSGMFYYYVSILGEFDVHFTRLTVPEFEQKIAEQNETNKGKDDFSQTNIMDNYNMIILGYADCYSDVNDEACKVIDTYIEEGNTTLFTHDTTSYINLDTNEFAKANTKGGTDSVYWGYNINKYFRKIVGMDRYNVTGNKGNKNLIDVNDDSYDKPYKTDTEQKDNILEEDNSGKALNQGMTYATLYINDEGKISPASVVNSTSVTQTNDGQIVSYPYLIPDKLDVATTHAQYYQLNLDEDDIVVWYCIGQQDDENWCYSQKNDVRNNYYIYNKGNITYSGAGHSSGMTEQEIKLFINTMIAAYNAGVTPPQPVITNADKSTDNKDTDFVYIDYDATVSPDESQPFGSGLFDKSVDSYSGEKKDVKTKRIFFKVNNNSIVMNKEMSVHYFPAVRDESGNVRILSSFPLPLKTYRVDDDDKKYSKDHEGATAVGTSTISVPQKVITGNGVNTKVSLTGGIVDTDEEYYVDVPISDSYYEGITYGEGNTKFGALDNSNQFALQIQVIMRYGKDKDSKLPLRGYRNLFIMRRGMFALD